MKQLIANDLLPIYQTTDTGDKVVDARELYGYLNVGSRYNDWIKGRIEKYGFMESEDFITLTENLVSGGKQNTHILKLDMAKELAMVENNEQGRKARQYFIEVEKRYTRASHQISNIQNDKITRLLQMLNMAEREQLFSHRLNRVFREEVAELVLGHTPIQEKPLLVGPASFVNQDAPYTERWYLTSEIAEMAGVSVQLVVAMSSKHGMRSDEYSRAVKSDPRKASGLVQIMYNENAKDKLLELLKGKNLRKPKKSLTSRK